LLNPSPDTWLLAFSKKQPQFKKLLFLSKNSCYIIVTPNQIQIFELQFDQYDFDSNPLNFSILSTYRAHTDTLQLLRTYYKIFLT